MIFNKMIRIIWGISFLISLLAILIFNYDGVFRMGFGIVSAVLFTADFIIISTIYKNFSVFRLFEKRWHLFLGFTQWLFWVMILYIPFRAELSLGYKMFFITDLFIVATFAFYKFTNQEIR